MVLGGVLIIFAHDLVRKPVATLGSSPRAGFSGSCACTANLGRRARRENEMFLSAPAKAGEGDHTKCGGGGVGGEASL